MEHDLHNGPAKTVLYVEDHPVNVLLMQALFERRPGLRLVVATSGQRAWRISAHLHPVLLLLDLRLPDCHGTELLALLRQRPGCAGVAAVAVTAEPDFDPSGTGFSEIWAKPLDLVFVLRRLGQLLEPAVDAMPPGSTEPPMDLTFDGGLFANPAR